MKKLATRGLSILLTLLMLVTSIPLTVTPAAADPEDPTVSTIDISFNRPTETKEEAYAAQTNFQPIAESEVSSMVPVGGYWKRPRRLFNIDLSTYKDYRSLQHYMSSTDENDKYISLVQDIDYNETKTEMPEIHITSDKILDLNGHTITFRDDTNGRKIEKGTIQDRTDIKWHSQVLFRIMNGATLTIIDSSQDKDHPNGRGGIQITGKIISPWVNSWIEHYTSRDLFWVDDGNLVIYGGNYQAGRKKTQVKKKFTLDKLKSFFGTALATGVSVASYATGIDAAVAAKADLVTSFLTQGETSTEDDGQSDALSSTKKEAAQIKSEMKIQSPKGESIGRASSTGEKQNSVDNNEKGKKNTSENGKNLPNQDGSAKSDTQEDTKESKKQEKGKNSQIADANKKIVDSVLDKSKITDIFDNVWSLGEQIAGMIGNDESTRLTATVFGTVVHVGNGGTFVSYGGAYAGHGSTPNVRDAVIEVTRGDAKSTFGDEGMPKVERYTGGKAYIYGGSFAAYSGANVFNFVQAGLTRTQQVSYTDVSKTSQQYQTLTLPYTETNGLKVLGDYEPLNAQKLLDTSNVQIRGGSFANYYELMNLATGYGDAGNFAKFVGTPGGVGLGVGSFNEKFIKDGRIQISDSKGDGALVLMDEDSGEDGDLYHYRLFCSDLELRYKQALVVYPNETLTNSTQSMKLLADYGESQTPNLKNVLVTDKENIRSPLSTTERLLYFPTNQTADSKTIVLSPKMEGILPDGTGMDYSPSWYYSQPTDMGNHPIETLEIKDLYRRVEPSYNVTAKDPAQAVVGVDSLFGRAVTIGGKVYVDQRTMHDGDWDRITRLKGNAATDTFGFTEKYHANVKWFEYKIYRVDPLTRENINDKTGHTDSDEPLATAVYGSKPDEMYKVNIRLSDLEKKVKEETDSDWGGFKPGEMYRITLNVEESLSYNYLGYDVEAQTARIKNGKPLNYASNLGTARASSSVLIMCYGPDEVKADPANPTGDEIPDFTPLQWVDTPEVGKKAQIQLVNGKTGNIDYRTRLLFDIYYQWWIVDENGEDKELIAGTTDVWDVKTKYYAAKDALWQSGESLTYNDEDYNIRSTVGYKVTEGKPNHRPSNINRAVTGKLYKNPIAPDDECLDWVDMNGNKVVYDGDGLPVDYHTGWPSDDGETMSGDKQARLLHAYAKEWTDIKKLMADTSKKLSLNNNNPDYGHTDTCYIGPEYAGQKVRVKAIVVNTFWPDYYDILQTFTSHVFEIPEAVFANDLAPSLKVQKTADYICLDKPAALLVDKVDGLEAGEFVTGVTYTATDPNGSKWTRSFNNLKKNEEIPTAHFPEDFFDEEYLEKNGRWAPIGAREFTFKASVKTNFTTAKNKRTGESNSVLERYEVEALGYQAVKEKLSFDYDREIATGQIKSGEIKLVRMLPYNATIADYSSASSDNEAVASVDESGKLAFGGSTGRANLTFTAPSGERFAIAVEVVDYVDDVEITGIQPPEIGKTFETSVTIPDNADYRVARVYWTDASGNELPASEKARNYKSYTVNVEIAKQNDAQRFRQGDGTYLDYHPYTLVAALPDGTSDAVKNDRLHGKFEYVKNDLTDEYEVGDKCTYSYTYNTAVGGADAVIHTISVSFPTEVREGDSVDAWFRQFAFATNGDDSEFKFEPVITLTSFSGQTLASYGYDPNLGHTPNRYEIKSFAKNVTDGAAVNVDLIWKGNVQFADKVKLVINGEESEKVEKASIKFSDTEYRVVCKDCFTMLEGRVLSEIPYYRDKPVYFVVGETVKLDDYLTSVGGDNLRLVMDGDELASASYNDGFATYYLKDYLSYDPAENTVTVKGAFKDYYGKDYVFHAPLYVAYDANNDGVADMRQAVSYNSSIFATEAEVYADKSREFDVKVTAYRPDGTRAYSDYFTAYSKDYTQESTLADLNLPVVEDAVVSRIERVREGYFNYDLSYGIERLKARLREGDELTIYTVDPSALLETNVGESEMHPDIPGVSGINVSLDGEHWCQSKNVLVGLTPNTEYMLYYKQGLNGTVFNRVVKTALAGSDLGVYVGYMALSNDRLGNLERDGYHYDPETKTLTLKDKTIESMGVDIGGYSLAGIDMRYQAPIYAKQDLTIELIGNNAVTKLQGESSFIIDAVIWSEGRLTITGNGSLVVTGNGDLSQGIVAYKNIYLNGTGKLSFKNVDFGMKIVDGSGKEASGKVFYKNGTLSIDPILRYSGFYFNAELATGDQFDASGAVHDVKYYIDEEHQKPMSAFDVKDTEEETQLEQYLSGILGKDASVQKAQYITLTHTYNKEIEKTDYLVSGTCETGATYHMSCSCGASGEGTFEALSCAHENVSFPGEAATCITEGYSDYTVCAKCGQSTFAKIAPIDHQFVHHDEVMPDCEHDGSPAYDYCVLCGLCSLSGKLKAAVVTEAGLPSGLAGAEEIERDDIWTAKGHPLVYVAGTAETCSTDGERGHYRCSICGDLFLDEQGLIPVEESDLLIPRSGHSWGEWTVTREVTETVDGEETRVCRNDENHQQTRVIPATGHVLELVPAKEATETEEGNLAYYKCSGCGKWFEDAEGKNEITDHASVILPAKAEPKLSKTSAVIAAGKTLTLTVTDGVVTSWSSDNTAVATVSGGKVKGIKAGTANVTANLEGGKSLTCKVTVVKISKNTATVAVGNTLKLAVGGSTVKSWTTSNKAVATVSGGTVKGVAVGTATISAKLKVGGTLTCKVTVVKLSKTSASLKAGAALTLKVTGMTVKSWASGSKAVATVTKAGKVTALKKGSAKITATLTDGTKLICTVKVTTDPTLKIGTKAYSSSTTYAVKKGKALTVTVTGKAASVNNVYATSSKAIAAVATTDKKATTIKIKGIKPGTATVSLKINGVVFKIKVKVTK